MCPRSSQLGLWGPGPPGAGDDLACSCPTEGSTLSAQKTDSLPLLVPRSPAFLTAWEQGVLCGKGQALGLEIAKYGQK